MSVDGSDIKMVVNRNIDFYNIHENQIYYTQYIKNDHSIHAISINGKKDRVVCDSRGDFLSIAGNYLFFLSNAPGGGPRDFVLYKTPLSGGKAEIEQLIK